MKAAWEDAFEAALGAEAFWDEGVEAARNACVAGAPLAAAAITAAAYYDNPLTGSRAMLAAHTRIGTLSLRAGLNAWLAVLEPAPQDETHESEHLPGFGFVRAATEAAVQATARRMSALMSAPRLSFWLAHEPEIRAVAGPLNVAGLCALVFLDAQIAADEAERRFLLLRLGPALAAAQRARSTGLARFPFFEDGYAYEGAWPNASVDDPCSDSELAALKREIGID